MTSFPIELQKDSFKAAIFDMDGTMIDNRDYHLKAWQIFLKKHKMEMTDEEFGRRLSGKRNRQILEDLFDGKLNDLEIAEYAREKEGIYREIYWEHVKEVPGLRKLIENLRLNNIKIAVATNSPKENVEFIFEVLNLEDVVDTAVWEEHVKVGKPNPEAFLHTAERLNVAPSECIVFEDSPTGVEAGKRAQMRVVAVLTGHTKEELKGTDFYVKDFNSVQLR